MPRSALTLKIVCGRIVGKHLSQIKLPLALICNILLHKLEFFEDARAAFKKSIDDKKDYFQQQVSGTCHGVVIVLDHDGLQNVTGFASLTLRKSFTRGICNLLSFLSVLASQVCQVIIPPLSSTKNQIRVNELSILYHGVQ
jgi:hypothetical protein